MESGPCRLEAVSAALSASSAEQDQSPYLFFFYLNTFSFSIRQPEENSAFMDKSNGNK